MRSRCRCAPARRSSSRAPTTPRRAGASRPSARASPRSAAAASRPVAAHHDGQTLRRSIAAEDGAWVERRSRRRSGWRSRDELLAAGPRGGMRASSPRPTAARRGALAARLEATGPRGRRVPADRDRAARGRADRLGRLRLARPHEPPTARDELLARLRGRPAAGGGDRARHGGGAARARRRAGPRPAASRPRRGCSPSCRGRPAACSSPAREGARPCCRRARGRLRRRSTAPSSSRRSFPAVDLVVLASASAARAFAALGRAFRSSRSARRRRPRRAALGLQVAAEADTHDLDGLVAAVRRRR